jgi:hypothetical protein
VNRLICNRAKYAVAGGAGSDPDYGYVGLNGRIAPIRHFSTLLQKNGAVNRQKKAGE